ncbi:MAG: response regulator [Cyanobacteria bacterium REEB67]|nr:response regulator [Cyanobacteria bacterium REEB67]
MPRPLNIVLVEDNPDDVYLMQALLKDARITSLLHVLKDGEQSIEFVNSIISGRRSVPDLIFLDLNLPKISGHEVLAEIRKHESLNNMRVVVLTTSDEPEDRKLALANGADCYCLKPPALENLWNVLDLVETACLNIALSRSEQPKSTESAADVLVRSSPYAGAHSILLIEDNQADVIFMRQMLQKANPGRYEIEVAETLKDSLTILQEKSFDLIFCDLGLPDAQGLQTLNGLNQASVEIPIIVLTGFDNEKLAVMAVAKGAQDYLVKGNINETALVRSMRYAVTRKQAEQMARMAVTFETAVLQEILQNAPISIARFDSALNITASNDVFLKQLKLESSQIVGQSIRSLLPNISSDLWDESVKNGRPFELERCRLRMPAGEGGDVDDGEDCPICDLVVWSIKGKDGDIRGGIIIGIDVSERVRLESQKEDFIAALAHDIKNPLIGAGQVLQSLVDGSFGNIEGPQRDVLGLLKTSNDNVLLMLHNLLDVYRYEAAAPSSNFNSIDIADSLSAAIATVAPFAADRSISVKAKVSTELRRVVGDSVAVHRLLTNLLHNALKYSRDKGTVEIYADNDNDENDFVVLRVVDYGAGMSPEQEKLLFKRFGHLRRSHGTEGSGTGLGLYLCQQIVDAHNGTISCSTRLNEGSTFEVRLPCAARVSELSLG